MGNPVNHPKNKGRNIRQELEKMYFEIAIVILLTLINSLMAMSELAILSARPCGLRCWPTKAASAPRPLSAWPKIPARSSPACSRDHAGQHHRWRLLRCDAGGATCRKRGWRRHAIRLCAAGRCWTGGSGDHLPVADCGSAGQASMTPPAIQTAHLTGGTLGSVAERIQSPRRRELLDPAMDQRDPQRHRRAS